MDDEFKLELLRIALDELPAGTEIVDVTAPSTYGWQRRPELDVPGLAVWERPDGSFAAVPAGRPDRTDH